MAYSDNPRGMIPIPDGKGKFKNEPELLSISASYNAAIYHYTPIVRSSGAAQCAATSGNIRGSAIDILDSNKLPIAYSPASTAGYCWVVYGNDQEFAIQDNYASSTAFAESNIGTKYDLDNPTSGSTTTGISTCDLSHTETNTQLTLQGLCDGYTWGQYAWVRVVIDNYDA